MAAEEQRICDARRVSSLPPEPPPPFPPEPWRSATVPEPPQGDLSFSCPRCDAEVQATTYGPCPACRTELRSTLGTGPREVATAAYEPRMNVTPNAVAVKE